MQTTTDREDADLVTGQCRLFGRLWREGCAQLSGGGWRVGKPERSRAPLTKHATPNVTSVTAATEARALTRGQGSKGEREEEVRDVQEGAGTHARQNQMVVSS